jgi:hypothetical protein
VLASQRRKLVRWFEGRKPGGVVLAWTCKDGSGGMGRVGVAWRGVALDGGGH